MHMRLSERTVGSVVGLRRGPCCGCRLGPLDRQKPGWRPYQCLYRVGHPILKKALNKTSTIGCKQKSARPKITTYHKKLFISPEHMQTSSQPCNPRPGTHTPSPLRNEKDLTSNAYVVASPPPPRLPQHLTTFQSEMESSSNLNAVSSPHPTPPRPSPALIVAVVAVVVVVAVVAAVVVVAAVAGRG